MKPILFNTEMVRAILDGRKTQTRRVVKPQPQSYSFDGRVYIFDEGELPKPQYQPGDILWVRETWTKLYWVDMEGYTHYDQPMYYYAADGTPDIILRDEDGFEEEDQRIRWRPSIHMPKEATRIFLRVTDVRVERLQSMTAEDSLREGVKLHLAGILNGEPPLAPFAQIWDSTIKPADRDRYGWVANPWVWVICFERYDPADPEGGSDGCC